MSYEPTLVINKDDLSLHEDKFDKYYLLKKGSVKYTMLKYLNDIFNQGYVDSPKIGGIRLIICKPEGSKFNKAVCKQLKDWSVEYDTDI
jgi:hypothetical protein